MKLGNYSKQAVEIFEHLKKIMLSQNKDDGSIDLFLLPINSRQFDYKKVINGLLESVPEYSLNNKFRQENGSMQISLRAREKFRNYTKNEGELGEMLLFIFLEGYLEAPKILTKLGLKTNSNLYVNGADGVHLKKECSDVYKLIFGESKMYKNLKDGLNAAIESICSFKNDGITYEKNLLSNYIERDVFSEKEQEILEYLIYPDKHNSNELRVDDAFSIFIGYEINIDYEQRELSGDKFNNKIKEKVLEEVNKYKEYIYKKIYESNLLGHTFYVFIIPFTDIEKNRKEILGEMLK